MLFRSPEYSGSNLFPQPSHSSKVFGFTLGQVRKDYRLARIIHEPPSRDRKGERATGQPQGLGSEAYLNSTSQATRPEDARKDDHICGRSRRFVNNTG